ncbi:MAG: glycosyltransferase family 4 protein, partial [Halioglobus sp.]|nr:glycosyltransferase family 4 protein [Halioglobus sp.]
MERRFSDGMRRRRGAIYHETNYIFMPCTGPCVTTVHDLSYISHASFHPQNVIDLLESKLPETIRRADRIITDSNVVRNELLQHFAIPDEKVRTVYLGADEAYRPRTGEQTSAVLADYGLSHGQYVLLTATLEPRKGIDTLLDAWAMLPETLRRAFPLVLTGSAGWRNGGVLAKLSSLLAEGTVHYLGYVPAEVLPVLFSGAAVFTYPSVYEGFGLPVLEAMSSGVPVVCRDGTAMAEFAQGSCVLCVDGHAAELSANIEMLLNDEQVRAAWAEKGLRQARKFS